MVFALVACNTSVTKETEKKVVNVEIADLISNTDQYAEEKIEVTALVHHICSHGGKKMFLIDQVSEERIKVVPAENVAAFNKDLEGHQVTVIGAMEKLVIDEAYLKEWEAELMAEVAEEHDHDHAEGEEHHHGEEGSKADQADQGIHIPAMESIANYRKEIEETGKALVFYTVICEKIKTVEIETAE